MNKRKIWRRFGILLVLTLALSGCGKGSVKETIPEEETVEGENSFAEQQQPDVAVIEETLLEEENDEQEEKTAVSQRRSWAVSYAVDGKSLSDSESSVYNALKACIEEVARGERETTQFSLRTALSEETLSQLNVNTIVFYLLNDCPFDLYWHDKTQTIEDGKAVDGVYCKYYPDGRVEFSFKVASAYRKSPDNLYQVNNASIDRVNHARAKAQAIVDANKTASDYNKLLAYRNAVCDLVTYDAAAIANGVYGDAYQPIYVFDEDPNTNVVCEGYAKAFKYLCDLTDFQSDVTCYSVAGVSDSGQGAGEHMWNIVRIGGENGESYLVDTTNCDAGTIGADYELFMADNPEGNVDISYTFYCNGWAPITYTYNAEPREIFGATILSLNNASHEAQDTLYGEQGNQDPGTPEEGVQDSLHGEQGNQDPGTPEVGAQPQPSTTSATPTPTPTTENNTPNQPNQPNQPQNNEAEKTAEPTSTLSFDVTELNKTYGDGTYVETVSGSLEDSKITYKSSDESVAQIVNKKGKVRILKPGTTTITAADSNGGSTASYKLTVAKKPLTWDVSGLSATDLKDNIGPEGDATLFGEMTIEGILEGDKDKDSKFSFDSNDLSATYTSTIVGTQKVTLNWKEGKKRTLNGEKADYYELPDTLPELTGEITSTTVLDTPPESTDELTLELEMENSISQVPEAFLEDKSLELDTPAKIQAAIETKVQEWDSSISDENIAVYDVSLRSLDKASDIESDEGSWVEVTDERFPEEGVTVTLPYPKGTSGRKQDFVVCHMFAENMYLSSPGEVEYPEVTETDKGIQFKVYGLSPIAVGWTDGHQTQPEVLTSDTSDTLDKQVIASGEKNDQKQSKKSQVNAGTSRILQYLIFAAVVLVFIGVVLVIALRKKKH